MQITVNNDFQHGGQVFSQAQINSFLQDEQTAINIFDSTFTDNISVVFNVGFGSYQGVTLNNQTISEADVNSNAVFTLSYSQLRQDLLTFGQPGFFTAANLPAGTSLNGHTNFYVSSSVGAIFGLFTNDVDGFVGIGTGFTPGAERVSAFLHEMGHAMGRVPENLTINGQTYFSALDLVRFVSQGNRLFDGSNPNHTPAYFSLDGGATVITHWGTESDVSDFQNGNVFANDPFNENVGDLGQLTNADILLRNANTGGFEVYDVSNNNITRAAFLGNVGLDWQVMGFGNFSSFGETDMILRNAKNGGVEVYDIRNNQIIGANFMGAVGLDWQVASFGNFSSRGTSDMILRNANNGGLEVYDINSNQITGAAFMGVVGLDWKVLAFGNFSGSPGETDMIMRNSNTGGMVIYDIASNQVTSAFFIGAVGVDWQFAGVAPVHSPGASDLVLRNVNTGAFEVYDIAGNTLIGAASLGAVGLDWQLGGVAVDPPTDNSGDIGQLVQAMAGFDDSGGAVDGLNGGFINDTSQQALLTAPQHA
jgi:hypothetical protein